MMGGVSRRPLCLLRNALVPLSGSVHTLAIASHGFLHPHSLHYDIRAKLLLFAAAETKNCRRIDAIDAVRTLADCRS